ncbi:hypothetical protein [Nodularia sp. UHCC 0506]|nr:hypothetical protein [Nodularia sp. UHCC 0506]MEA5517298.1 hypothetical protein [Nodularia sp. UHCC 0506]
MSSAMGKAPPKAIANSLQMVLVSDRHPRHSAPRDFCFKNN